MTEAERATALEKITAAQSKVAQYDVIQQEIERIQAMEGNVYQVVFSDAGGLQLKVSDPEMVIKAEGAVSKMLTAKRAEQAAL